MPTLGEFRKHRWDKISKDLPAAPKGKSTSDWFKSLTKEAQRAYIQAHPNSKYAKAARHDVNVKRADNAKRNLNKKERELKKAHKKAYKAAEAIKDYKNKAHPNKETHKQITKALKHEEKQAKFKVKLHKNILRGYKNAIKLVEPKGK